MKYPAGHELPDELQELHRKAVRLEWISLAYLVSAVIAIYFTLGSSQAMKGAWLEDMLSLLPPIAFLVAARVRHRRPTAEHPYGHHRSVEIAYLASALALLFMGFYLIIDSILDLLSGDHPSIGMVELFDWQVWLGWLMLAALLWSAIPAVILGRMKTKLAGPLHDKVLHADAQMNRADWLTATAAMVGVIGIGLGVWFADAVAAIAIGADIFRDGCKYTLAAVHDLLDGRPRRYDETGEHPLTDEIRSFVARQDWIEEGVVRVRDIGHTFAVNLLVVPESDEQLTERCERLMAAVRDLDWKLHDVTVSPVASIDGAPEGAVIEALPLPTARPTETEA